MAKLYRITPLEKKSVEFFVDVYEELSDGSVRGFQVTETWRWGQGFRELDNEVYENEAKYVACNPTVGWGCELDDLCAVNVEFDDSYTEEEQDEIRAYLYGDKEDDEGLSGTAWLFDGEHNHQIEENIVYIIGPVKIDIVDEDQYNITVEENIQPKKVNPLTSWPFSPGFPEEVS